MGMIYTGGSSFPLPVASILTGQTEGGFTETAKTGGKRLLGGLLILAALAAPKYLGGPGSPFDATGGLVKWGVMGGAGLLGFLLITGRL